METHQKLHLSRRTDPASQDQGEARRDRPARWWGRSAYKGPMNPTLNSSSNAPSSPVPSLDGLDFLTETDRTRIRAALLASHAPSTRQIYATLWARWQTWCTARGITALPADPVAVCAYLTERAAAGIAIASLDVACSAIGYRHREAGQANPIHDPTVERLRAGLRRSYGTTPRRTAHPLTTAEIARIVTTIDRDHPRGARDTALILLGYAAALRVGELAALTLADLTHRPDGLLLRIRAAKTDPTRAGQSVAVAPGQNPATCPIAALQDWLNLRGHTPGPLFVSLRGHYHPTPTGTLASTGGGAPLQLVAMTPTTAADIVHDRAHAAGLDATRITGHSLRAGHATTAALAGVPLHRIAAQTRHRQIAVLLDRYIRPAQALEISSSHHLGL